MMMRLFPSLAIFIVLFAGCETLWWADSLYDYEHVYFCQGRQIVLDWSFSLQHGEAVSDIMWHYSHDGSLYHERLIAIEVEGHFTSLNVMPQSLYHVPNAGLRLNYARDDVAGTYKVSISTHHGHTQFQTYNKTVRVSVTIPPTTRYGEALRVSQDMTDVIKHPNSTEITKWHLQLTCGAFTYLGRPPVDVEWITPKGVEYSTSHNGTHFWLVLPNPVEGGNYTCSLPNSTAAACLSDYSQLWDEASVYVDELEVRVSLLEHVQEDLLKENEVLTQENEALKAGQGNLSSLTQELDHREDLTETHVHQLEEHVHQLEAENSHLQTELVEEQQRNNELESRLTWLERLFRLSGLAPTTEPPDSETTDYYHPNWWWTTDYQRHPL